MVGEETLEGKCSQRAVIEESHAKICCQIRDGWMMADLQFYVLSTVFQSYQNERSVIMKG